VRTSARFQIAATLMKLALLLALIGAGCLAPAVESVHFLPTEADTALLWRGEFVVALLFVSFSYSGWNAAVYIAGEIRNPGRWLPAALLAGTGAVAVIYILVNVAFLRAAPIDELAGQPDVALVAARHLFGARGGEVMGLLIAIGLVSTVSAMTWAGPRVTKTMGEDWGLFRPLSRVTAAGVPALATLCQATVSLALLTFGGFAEVLTYTEFTLSLSTFLTVAGVFWLRWRRPELPRPFKTWGYPVTPALFLLLTGYVLVRFATDPKQWTKSLLGFATVAAGAVLYLFSSPGRREQG
jgi:basic amino acid/polyamine antiporter, APA family